jgi:hypothetical protein
VYAWCKADPFQDIEEKYIRNMIVHKQVLKESLFSIARKDLEYFA